MSWRLRQRLQPVSHDRFGDLIDEEEVTLGQHILVQMRARHVMPFESFRAMPDRAMSL